MKKQLKVTGIRVYKVNSKSNVKAYVSITIEDCLVLTGIRIVEGKKGLFVAFPSTPDKDKKEYYDVYYFLDGGLPVKTAILDEYNKK